MATRTCAPPAKKKHICACAVSARFVMMVLHTMPTSIAMIAPKSSAAVSAAGSHDFSVYLDLTRFQGD